jgi:hypothetical protein
MAAVLQRERAFKECRHDFPVTQAASPDVTPPAAATGGKTPAPLAAGVLGVGDTQTVVVLFTAADNQDPAFRAGIASHEAEGWPISVLYVGCSSGATEALGEAAQWMSSVAFRSEDDAQRFVTAHKLEPLATVTEEIEPCGD